MKVKVKLLSRVQLLVSDKIDFKTKAVKRDKDGHYIIIKGSFQEEDITIINMYAPNLGIEPVSLPSPALAGRFFTTVPPGKPNIIY